MWASLIVVLVQSGLPQVAEKMNRKLKVTRGLLPCLHSLISKQEELREFETVIQTRDAV